MSASELDPPVPTETPVALVRSNSWVQKTRGVCNGKACVRNTRITIWELVEWRKLGLSDNLILTNVEGLTKSDLLAAWDYYKHNQAEIDEDIKEMRRPERLK